MSSRPLENSFGRGTYVIYAVIVCFVCVPSHGRAKPKWIVFGRGRKRGREGKEGKKEQKTDSGSAPNPSYIAFSKVKFYAPSEMKIKMMSLPTSLNSRIQEDHLCEMTLQNPKSYTQGHYF